MSARDMVMRPSQPRTMMLRVEPAGYMLTLVRALQDIWPGEVDAVFMHEGLTQDWSVNDLKFEHAVLPERQVKAISAIRRRIDETKPDLLHVAGWRQLPSLAAILSARQRNLPVVVDSDTWQGAPSRWRSATKQLLYPYLFNRISHFAPGGERQAAYLRSFGVPDEKMTKIGMTVDVSGIRNFLKREPNAGAAFRRRFNIDPDAMLALYMGRLTSLKGIGDLLSAFPEAQSQAPELQLMIAGDGELSDRVAAAASSTRGLHRAGRLQGDDVWRAYAAADFLVAPSHFEGWGLVVNEAMAAGTPIIATNVFGCIGDLLHQEKTGLLVPPRSPESLSKAIIRMALETDTRSRFADAAGDLISQWTIEHEAERVAAIWQRVLAH